MALPGLLPLTDFKKEYNFYWQLNGLTSSIFTDPAIEVEKYKNLAYLAFKSIAVAEMLYVSQLAESIHLPDDELEIETYDVGSVKLPVAKGFKMPDIRVTYLEDTFNTVYNFHKYRMNCVKSKGGFDMNTIRPWCMEGWYLPLDKSVNQYVAIAQQVTSDSEAARSVNEAIGNSGSHIYNPVTDGVVDVATSLSLRGLQIYPLIFPTKISRGSMNKGGNGLAKVTVTYVRFPLLKNKSANCQKYSSFTNSWYKPQYDWDL